MRRKKESISYEKMDHNQLYSAIEKLEKRTTVYFIGFGVFFIMTLFYSMTANPYFTVLVGYIFMAVLCIYYMIAFVFVRLLMIIQFNEYPINALNDDSKNNEIPIENREKIPEI